MDRRAYAQIWGIRYGRPLKEGRVPRNVVYTREELLAFREIRRNMSLKLKTEQLEALAWYVVDYEKMQEGIALPATVNRYEAIQGWPIRSLPTPETVSLAILQGNVLVYLPILERALKRGKVNVDVVTE
jgi:hypothetical protein